jgi:tetratricopeptide (TPR) repeat protein
VAAESRGDLEEAADNFMKAEDLDPESAEIEAHLEHLKVELAERRADQESADHIRAERQRIDDSINAAHIRAQRMELEEKLARHQERAAAVDPVSAACIFDGSPGCTEPIPVAVVNSGTPPIPADAARFIESIPKGVRERPEVKRKIDYYARTARIRGALQNKMIADKAAAGANPGDKAKLRLVGDEGSLKAAVVDEHEAKKPLLDFSADTIELEPALGNGDHPK